MQNKFPLELCNQHNLKSFTDFYFRSCLNAFIVEYIKNIFDLNESIDENTRKYQNQSLQKTLNLVVTSKILIALLQSKIFAELLSD